MNKILKDKLKALPSSPGVYFHKNSNGEIIYIGKAAVLKNRVRQYFHNINQKDIKTQALVTEITDVDWQETDSEIDALFLESELIKRYKPRFNVLLRDDKSQTFVRIDMKSDWPVVSFTRNPADDGADYYGPFYNGLALKKALRYLRRVFPYYISNPKKKAVSRLDEDLGLSPRREDGREAYKDNLRKLISYIKGHKKTLILELKRQMKAAASVENFEEAAKLRNKLRTIKELQKKVYFGDKEFLDISKDEALADLVSLLNLPDIPRRIEGYDISHMSGTNVVASMVVFTNGVSDRSEYRKFKTRIEHNDDFYNMNEVITRRFSDKNIQRWQTPGLIIIDGGKGQLEAATVARDQAGADIPFIGLAKKEEKIVVKATGKSLIKINFKKMTQLGGQIETSDSFVMINLPNNSHIIKLLQRIRDESHRFAVGYHTVLKRKSQTFSILDDISGVGPKTRQKLMKKFGSLTAIKKADQSALSDVIGAKLAKKLHDYLGAFN